MEVDKTTNENRSRLKHNQIKQFENIIETIHRLILQII